jgi:hypothetical protein
MAEPYLARLAQILDELGPLLATSKNGTLCYPRDQVMDEGPVSSLRALL